MKAHRFAAAAAVAAFGLAAGTTAALAQSVEEFYGKNDITFVVSAAPAGGADIYIRAFAPFFAKHMPGSPNVIVTNVPGASGLTAATQLQTNTPNDGTVVALLQSNNLYVPLISDKKIPFDPREVDWLGSLARERHVLVTWKTSGITSLDELMATKEPFIIGATTLNQINGTLPALMERSLTEVPIEIVTGYQGTDEILLAMQRGEVMGRSQSVTSLFAGAEQQYVKSGDLIPIAQLTRFPHPALPDVPTIMDKITDPTANQIFDFVLLPLAASRPVAVPKGVPGDRLAALRQAFADAANDPGFHAALEQMAASTELLTGDEVKEIVEKIYATPPDVLKVVGELLN